MKFRIMSKKLNFLWHLKNLKEGTLANEVFQVQMKQNLPGLVRECSEWISSLKLPNIFEVEITKPQWKRLVKQTIKKENESDLRIKMKSYAKLKYSDMMKDKCEIKPYIKDLSVIDARQIFKKKSSMSRFVKMNYMNEARYVKDLWLCDSCQISTDSMDHVTWCPSYRELRKGRNMDDDKDMAKYLHDVMSIRSKLDLQR